MSALDYSVEPEVDYLDSGVNDVAFMRATTTIGGRDAMEEFLAYGMYPLASNFGFKDVAIGTTVVLKVETLLLTFLVGAISAEEVGRFLAKVETDIERVLGSYEPREHDACVIAKLPNAGRLN
jgi:hypothetical protein